MVWYRVRVSESQRHTPTQNFKEYLPRAKVIVYILNFEIYPI